MCRADQIDAHIYWSDSVWGYGNNDGVFTVGEVTAIIDQVTGDVTTPCLEPDTDRHLTVRNAAGDVVYDWAAVGSSGPARLIYPNMWLMANGTIGWDSTCVRPVPDDVTATCTPLTAGTYTVTEHAHGGDSNQLTITVVDP